MTPTSLDIAIKNETQSYRWNELKEVTIWRLEAGRRDFRKLTLKFSDREIELQRSSHKGSEVTNWKGAASDVISEFVMSFVDHDIVRDFVQTGPSRSLEEAKLRFEIAEKCYIEVKNIRWLPIGLTLLSLPFLLWNNPWSEKMITGIPFTMLLYAIYWMVNDQLIAARKEYDQFNDEVLAFTSSAAKSEPS